jgi:hypothetical protein
VDPARNDASGSPHQAAPQADDWGDLPYGPGEVLPRAFTAWQQAVESAALREGVLPPASLPDSLAERLQVLGRAHDAWRPCLRSLERDIADQENAARITGVRIPISMRQVWLLQHRYLEQTAGLLAAAYGAARGEAEARLISLRWDVRSATSDLEAIGRQIRGLRNPELVAILRKLDDESGVTDGARSAALPTSPPVITGHWSGFWDDLLTRPLEVWEGNRTFASNRAFFSRVRAEILAHAVDLQERPVTPSWLDHRCGISRRTLWRALRRAGLTAAWLGTIPQPPETRAA